mmetsp:Transcript_23572/g.39279  ORF Transcript_23572/g.39279 Transcript_23572/m.39279 type:complete len:84 (+) Transcript_23572:233-484(+)
MAIITGEILDHRHRRGNPVSALPTTPPQLSSQVLARPNGFPEEHVGSSAHLPPAWLLSLNVSGYSGTTGEYFVPAMPPTSPLV